jgi:hypothetical protein
MHACSLNEKEFGGTKQNEISKEDETLKDKLKEKVLLYTVIYFSL